MKAFRDLVEAGFAGGEWDLKGIWDLLDDDVVFTSPVAHEAYPGKAITAAILQGVSRVFTDFTYRYDIEDGNRSALVFDAKVPAPDGTALDIQGCDFLTLNDHGLISEFTVMVRPLSAAKALAEAVGAEFDTITNDAIALMTTGAPQ